MACVTPQARLEGNNQQILAERHRKLATAQLTEDIAHHQVPTKWACECAGIWAAETRPDALGSGGSLAGRANSPFCAELQETA